MTIETDDDINPVTAAIEAEAARAYDRLVAARKLASTTGAEYDALRAAAHVGAHIEGLRETILLAAQPKPLQGLTRGEREHVQMVEEVLGVTQAQLSREHGALIECLALLESIGAALTNDATERLSPGTIANLGAQCDRTVKRCRALVAPVTDLVEGP